MAFEAQRDTSPKEAVGLFDSVERLERAIDDLQADGFDRSELSLLASQDAVRRRLGTGWTATGDLADVLAVPRTSYDEPESVTEAKSGIVAAAAYVPAIIGSVIVAASGGTALAVATVALASCGVGGSIGLWLARLVGRERAAAMAGHLQRGGLLLWVHARDAEHEARALDILRKAGATNVHLHELPEWHEPPREVRFAPIIRPEDRFVY